MASISTPIVNSKYISSIYHNDRSNYSINSIKADKLSEEAIDQIKQLFNAKPLVEYSCHKCGASLQLEPENHIFKCKYCGSVYMVGLDQINSGR